MEFLRKGHELEDAIAAHNHALKVFLRQAEEPCLAEKFLTACGYIIDLLEEKEDKGEAMEEKTDNDQDAYWIWLKWFQLCCNYEVTPTGDETWNGAIETIAPYLENELIGNIGYAKATELVKKLVEKFKVK